MKLTAGQATVAAHDCAEEMVEFDTELDRSGATTTTEECGVCGRVLRGPYSDTVLPRWPDPRSPFHA